MMTSIPGAESNYIKIALLVVNISQKAVRVKFDFEFHPKCLQKTLNKESVKLKDLVHQNQRELLFPPKGKGDASSNTFDITLMICLIRNLTDIQIGSTLPESSQTGLGDDLTRIHVYRNIIAHHVGNAQINDTDFSKYWDDISQATIRLGGEELREECVQLKDKKFSIEEIEESFRHINMELAAVKNILQEVKDKMKYIEEEQNDPIPRNIREQITTQIDEWKNKDTKFFVITKRSEHALQRLEVSSCVVLTGGPGVGKTFIARHLALTFERKGYRLIPVLEPRDIRQFYEKGKKSIFIVDDMCGSYTANQHLVDNWQQLSPVIKTMLSDECCKIIVSCRRQIYLDERFKLLSPFQDCECNLMTKRLRTKEIKQMIARYNISAKVLSTESCKFECFPLLCSLYHENERVDTMEFFKNPFEIYRTELNNLDKSGFDGKCTLCGLALCVLFNNKIDEKWFQSKVNHDEENMLEDAYRVCGLNRGTSNVLIGEAFRTLEGTYICKQNGIYTTVHDRLFDFLVYYFGTKMLQCLIEHGNSNLIRERFRWRDPTETIDEDMDFITEIPDHSLQMFLDRLIKDWSNGRPSIVFYNNNLKDKAFRKKFLKYLEQLDKADQVKLANTMDKMFPKEDSCSGNYPIIDVCYQGYDDILQWLLDNDANINQRRDDGNTPLIVASSFGSTECVVMLLKLNPDVNACTETKVTALHMACQNNYLSIVKQLLKTDIDVNFCDGHGQSPLFHACGKGSTATVANLLSKSPDVNQSTKAGCSPLHIACSIGSIDVVTLLLESKNVNIDVNATDANGFTALVIACFKNNTEIASLLINAKAYVDIQAFNGASALCFAIGHGNLETTILLLKNNASLQTGFKNRQQIMDALSKTPERTINNIQEEIRTFFVKNALPNVREYVSKMSRDYWFDAFVDSSPLHIASFMGHTHIVSCLLNFGAYVDFTKEDGTTPLFYACELGHDAIVRLLLDNGADLNIQRRPDVRNSKSGSNSLHIACLSGHTAVVTLLLVSKNVKININARDSNGYTPLIIACCGNFIEITSLLINAKADVDIQTSNGATALCFAVGNNNIETTELLLTNNASWQIGFQNRQQLIDATQHPGITLESVKEEIRNFVVKNASQQLTDYVNEQSEDYVFNAMAGSSPLHIASFMGHTQLVSCLLNFGAYVDFTKEDGTTPLFYACELGHDAIVRVLLDNGADSNIRRRPDVKDSKGGSNSLHIACVSGHTGVVNLLLTSKNVEININARNSNGYTPLINACYGNFTEITSILINAKADVNMQTSNGATALCLAVGYNNIDTTELLLTSNASWQIGFQNRQQLIDATQHPDVTLEGEKEEIRNFVLKNASQTVTDYVKKQSEDYIFDAIAGSLPLHIASFMGHTRIVSCLLNFGAFVDFTKEDGTTPLFYACELGHDDIVGLLLDKGADVTIRRQDGKSSLNIAECHGHQSIIAMLMERGTD